MGHEGAGQTDTYHTPLHLVLTCIWPPHLLLCGHLQETGNPRLVLQRECTWSDGEEGWGNGRAARGVSGAGPSTGSPPAPDHTAVVWS